MFYHFNTLFVIVTRRASHKIIFRATVRDGKAPARLRTFSNNRRVCISRALRLINWRRFTRFSFFPFFFFSLVCLFSFFFLSVRKFRTTNESRKRFVITYRSNYNRVSEQMFSFEIFIHIILVFIYLFFFSRVFGIIIIPLLFYDFGRNRWRIIKMLLPRGEIKKTYIKIVESLKPLCAIIIISR